MTKEEAIEILRYLPINIGRQNGKYLIQEAMNMAIESLSKEIVRCKDCKYYLHSNEKCELIDTRLHFYETDNTWAEDAFCAWGERRDK